MRHKSNLSNERGLSLIEATIILITLMVLASVMAPTVMSYVDDARVVKVKEDCEAIGVSLARMIVDTGACVRLDGRFPCTIDNRVNLLFSEGHAIRVRGEGAELFSYSLDYSTSVIRQVASYSFSDYVHRGMASDVHWNIATHLGGATAFTSKIRSGADLRLMANTYASDLQVLLTRAGVDSPESVINALAKIAVTDSRPRLCDDVELLDNNATRCVMGPGLKMLWMVYRPQTGMNNRTADLLYNVQWSGENLDAFIFRVKTLKSAYTFIIPEICGNLSLVSIADRQIHSDIEQRVEKYVVTRQTTIGWASAYGVDETVDMLEHHLVEDRPSGRILNAYPYQDMAHVGYGPSMGMGWRGAYLSAVGPDPWGNHYMVNSIFLGNPSVRWPYNTVCLSAGPDGIVDTPFAAVGTKKLGDDFTYVISGRPY